MIRKIVSGGQTGADTGALKAAMAAGIPSGGWCPVDSRNNAGRIPPEYGLKPVPHDRSETAPDIPRSLRTEWNVRDSDATLLFLMDEPDPGSNWTLQCAREKYYKPIFIWNVDNDNEPGDFRQWFREEWETLNVAGPSEETCPGIEQRVFIIIYTLLITD